MAGQETEPATQFHFDKFPLWLRKGPWSPAAYAFISMTIGLWLYLAPQAVAMLPPTQVASERDRWISLFCFLWCVLVVVLLVMRAGVWPMYTFTMWSWTLIGIRFLAIFVGENVPLIHFLGEFSHGPAMINAAVVFLVWWSVLFPLIFYVMKSKKERDWFFKFNTSFNLINVHAVNILLAYMIRTFIPRSLVLYDLWSTLTVSLLYTLLYLIVFDRQGYHFYIILSPRTNFCFLIYSSLLGIMAFAYYCLGGKFEL